LALPPLQTRGICDCSGREVSRLVSWDLREAGVDDLEAWAASIYADPEVVRYLPKRDVTPLARTERTLARYVKLSWSTRSKAHWSATAN
jgi:hypothetical protein